VAPIAARGRAPASQAGALLAFKLTKFDRPPHFWPQLILGRRKNLSPFLSGIKLFGIRPLVHDVESGSRSLASGDSSSATSRQTYLLAQSHRAALVAMRVSHVENRASPLNLLR